MNKIVKIESQTLNFEFIENPKVWRTTSNIDNLEIEIEIDFSFHKENEVDWNHFENFFNFVTEKGRLQKLVQESYNLVLELGKAFYSDCFENVSDYKMTFSNSIFYNGKTDGNFVQNGYSYSLIYNYWAQRVDGIDGDSYGLYLVNIENNIVVGAKRHQC